MKLLRATLAAIPLACLCAYWLLMAWARKRRAEHGSPTNKPPGAHR